MLAAALGLCRTSDLTDLEALKFGVRIDQPGILLRDYHTARQQEGKSSFVTERYYLADAVFLIGLEGEKTILERLIYALQNPVFPLYLGRRSCPPVGPVVIGLRETTLRQAMEDEQWRASEWYKNKLSRKKAEIKLTLVRDAQDNEPGAFLRRDVPVSFDQRHRQYSFRAVVDTAEAISFPISQQTKELTTIHDALAGWED